jgi:DNA-binding NarL/FixJ family response regulator
VESQWISGDREFALPCPQGCIKLPGPRTVPVRSGPDSSRNFQFFEYSGVFLRAAKRDGSRSDTELDAALPSPGGGRISLSIASGQGQHSARMANKVARIVIVDDERMVAEALKAWLSTQADCVLAGYAGRGDEGHALCLSLRPNIALLDIDLPEMNGLELAEALLAELPDTRVLMMSGLMDPYTIWRVWQSGVHGYIDKTESLTSLTEAIRMVLRGERYFSPVFQEVKAQWLSQPDSFQKVLSEREQEVLKRVVSGWQDERIAKKLGVSAETIAFHRKNIRKKLNLHSDRDMVAYGRMWGVC